VAWLALGVVATLGVGSGWSGVGFGTAWDVLDTWFGPTWQQIHRIGDGQKCGNPPPEVLTLETLVNLDSAPVAGGGRPWARPQKGGQYKPSTS
jgi:hypothetical protein